MPLLILSKDNFIFPKKEELRYKQVLRTKKDKPQTKMTKAHYSQYFFFLFGNTHNTNLRNRRIKPWTPL